MTNYQFQAYITKNLKWAIIDSGLTNSKLSKMTGISPSLLIHYRNGDCMPTLTNIAKICFILGIQIDDIINVDMCGIIKK